MMANGTIGHLSAIADNPMEWTQISQEDRDRTYQGLVSLCVKATDSIRSVVSFVNALRQRHHVRVLELVGTAKGGVDIRLVLRKPLLLVEALHQIEGVSQVEATPYVHENRHGPLVNVQLD